MVSGVNLTKLAESNKIQLLWASEGMICIDPDEICTKSKIIFHMKLQFPNRKWKLFPFTHSNCCLFEL